MPQDHRMAVVKAIRRVDEVFLEESLEKKPEYCRRYNADVMVMGDDHLGRFDDILRGRTWRVPLPASHEPGIARPPCLKSPSRTTCC